MFIENKYSKWYFNIVNSRRESPLLNCYVERHHIIPKSMGGSNKAENIVSVSAREHFICHLLLVKMVSGKDKCKMAFALRCLMKRENSHQTRYKLNSILYSLLKDATGKIISESRKGVDNHFFGKKHSDKSRLVMSEKRKSQVMLKGWTHSEEAKEKIRIANAKQFEDERQIAMRREFSIQQWSDPVKRLEAGNGSRGTKWCNNPSTGEVKKIKLDEELPFGFIFGRGKLRKGA